MVDRSRDRRADCQTTFFGRFKRFGKILEKVAERSRDSGWGHATVGRLSNNVFDVSSDLGKFRKKSLNGHATGWGRRDRRPTVKQRFLDVSSGFGKILRERIPNGTVTRQ